MHKCALAEKTNLFLIYRLFPSPLKPPIPPPKANPKPPNRATVTDINRNIAATLKTTGPSLIADPSRLKHITEIILAIITKAHPCQKDFGDEEDLGRLEETSEYDWLTIDTAMDVICGLAGALGPTFAQLWKIFEKPIMKFASGSESFERSTAVGVIAECIKGMGADVTPSTSTLMTLLLKRMTDEDPETKSNAAYAMGLLQLHSTNDREVLKNFPTILARLEPLLQMREARAMDNAAGCVSRMIMRHGDKVPVAQVLPALLEILPLRNDFDENEPVYDMVVGLCMFCPFFFPPYPSPVIRVLSWKVGRVC